jgi:hypothetical protein
MIDCKVALRIAIIVLAVAGVSASASSAHAASSATCTGSSAVSYSPGLTNTPQNISWTITDTYSCTSTDTSLTAGGFSGNYSFSGASCNGAGLFPPSSGTVSWNNGQSSTMTLSVSTDVILLGTETVTSVGTVTSGEFTGGAVTIVWVYPVLNPTLCSSSQGVTSQSGTVTLQITVLP